MNKANTTRPAPTVGWDLSSLDDPGTTMLSPIGRGLLGAFYGLLIGVVYALMAETVDLLVMRDVPLRVDQSRLLQSTFVSGMGAALLGAISAWPASALRGVITGALVMAGWGILRAFVVSGANRALLTVTLLPTFLPTAMLSMPIAVLLRWIVGQHENNMDKRGWDWWLSQGGMLGVVMALALFAGSWAQMPAYAQEAVRQVNRIVQHQLTAPEGESLPIALRDVPDFRERVSGTYWIEQYPAASAPTAVEVGVYFDNGYAVSCLISSEGAPPACFEGSHLFSGVYNADDQR